jgi:hypothetical protein
MIETPFSCRGVYADFGWVSRAKPARDVGHSHFKGQLVLEKLRLPIKDAQPASEA